MNTDEKRTYKNLLYEQFARIGKALSNPHRLELLELLMQCEPTDRPVVTVCAAGKTSQIAAEQLASRGLQVFSLEGGMKAWSLAWNTAEVPLPRSSVRVIQVRRTGKGCLSYLIGDGETATV